jgi:hypothetical protein
VLDVPSVYSIRESAPATSRMTYMAMTVRPGVVGRSQVMPVIIRPNTSVMGIYVAAIGVVVRDSTVWGTAMVWLYVGSILAVVATHGYVGRGLPRDDKREQEDTN